MVSTLRFARHETASSVMDGGHVAFAPLPTLRTTAGHF
jgi:hypothetical protein